MPAVVEQDLKRIISDRLEHCGIYHRVFSRIKTAGSMARKFELKEYGEERKLQDLVGVRINLYFDDDQDIVRHMMEETFEAVGWSTSFRTEDEFKPTKLNGVFRLPEYLKAEISATTWDMFIDDTFEVQIKTMFFEGWHEIEHDMRYKGEELWSQYKGFSRYFNSILATLELCDKSIVTLFEDLGHELYKSGKWSDMIRSHFRLKLIDTPMYPEVVRILEEDQEMTINSLAKRIYKTDKAVLVDILLKKARRVPINVNTIVALLNDYEFHDQRLTRVFRERDVYNDGREESLAESRHYQMKPLSRHAVFRMTTQVDGSRLKEGEPVVPETIFAACAEMIYGWIRTKYGELFRDMPEEPATWQGDAPGYHVLVFYDPERLRMKMSVQHLDLDVGGRIWYSEADVRADDFDRIILHSENGYAEPEKEHEAGEIPGMFFSYPGYYKMIVDGIGIFNGISCSNRRRILHSEQLSQVYAALDDPDREFPVVLIISGEGEDGQMDEDWLEQFRVSDFTRAVWRYAHVFTCYEDTGRELLTARGLDGNGADAVPRLYIFWPDSDIESYGPEDVRNCSFGRHLEARDDDRTYDIVHGGQAFYHKIVTDLRDYNVSGR